MPDDIILKLFEMLKDAIDNVNDSLKDLLNNQKSITTYMKDLPIKDLSVALKDHDKESASNIDECTEVVNIQTKDIMKKLDKIYSIVFKTTVVVSVFITIVSCIFTYNRYLKPDPDHVDLEQTIIVLQETLKEQVEISDKRNKDQTKTINELREIIKEMHDAH